MTTSLTQGAHQKCAFWVIAVFKNFNEGETKPFIAPFQAIIIPILNKHDWQWAINLPVTNLLNQIRKSMLWYKSKVSFEFQALVDGFDEPKITLTADGHVVTITTAQIKNIYKQSGSDDAELNSNIFCLVDNSIKTLRQLKHKTENI